MNTVDTYKVEITNPGDISAGSGGDASAANQETGNTSLASIDTKVGTSNTTLTAIDGHVDGIEALLTTLNTKVDTLLSQTDGIEASLVSIDTGTPAALGAATAANSMPVTLSTDGAFATNFGAIADSEASNDTGSFSFLAFVKRLLNTKLKIGQQTKANSLSVTIASDDGVQGRGASGSAVSGNPVLIAGSDGTNARTLYTASDGSINQRASSAGPGDAIANTAFFKTEAAGNVVYHSDRLWLFNGSTWDRWRNINAVSILASAARTTSQNGADQTNYNFRGLLLTVDVTSAGTGSITPSIQVKDSVSGTYKTIWTAAAAITTNSNNVYALAVGASSAASYTEIANLLIGRTWRVVITANNANSITYSVSVDMLPI